MWAEYLAAQQRVTELEAQSAQLLTERNNLLEECIGYAERISAFESRMTEAQTEAIRLRECIDGRDAQIAANIRGSDDKNATIAQLRAQLAALTDPPRRTDGTLAPQPKPWTPPKDAGDRRRIGG